MAFLRRLLIALLTVAVVLVGGVALAFGWQKIHPSDQALSGVSASPAPLGTLPSVTLTPKPSSSASASAPPVTVPGDWVAYTDAVQKATFSHPGAWKQRRDNTGIFFAESGSGTTGFGPRMVGVARLPGLTASAALSSVQKSEFGAITGYHQLRHTSIAGTSNIEFAGTYLRENVRVDYVMRTVAVPGATYVLISRATTSAGAATATNLVDILAASFKPA